MKIEKKVYQLSIFLIKTSCTSVEHIVNASSCGEPIEIKIGNAAAGHLFIKKNEPVSPKWATLFKDYLDLDSLTIPSVSAVFAIEVNGRWFVLAFGQAGRFLIKDDVYEERFGLLCALNSVDPKTFRCVDVQSLDAIQSHTRIQSGQETTPDQFGLDVEQDMLKAIVGAPLNATLGNRMTGSDALSVTVKMDLSNLPFLLNEYRKQFEADINAKEHDWVNNISLTKNTALIGQLEAKLNARLSTNNFEHVWLSIPEIIQWETVKGFMYSGGRRLIFPDINLQGFLKTTKPGISVTLDLLRKRKVFCADADHKPVFRHWTLFKCIYAEIDYNDNKYILNDGKWFSVAAGFVAKTDTDFAKIPISHLPLPTYQGGGESEYNSSVAATEPERYALLDNTKKVMHGGGHGQIEICDLFSINRELIHVKIYGKSSVLSHLFSQGFVSGQLLQIDAEFRQKVREKLSPPFVDLLQVDKRPDQDEFTVVYAVISEEEGKALHLPFFSRVNLNNTAKLLKGFGYKVELLKISVDELFAKTVTVAPKFKKRKKA
jgi:uncharacterized protein (TIGR04141 family)